MKTALLALSLLLTPAAFAADNNYLCQIEGSDQTLLLRKIRDLPNQDPEIDQRAFYELQLQTTELPFPSLKVEGIAEIADVHLIFNSSDEKYSAHIYMDDGEGLFVDNGKNLRLDSCRPLK